MWKNERIAYGSVVLVSQLKPLRLSQRHGAIYGAYSDSIFFLFCHFENILHIFCLVVASAAFIHRNPTNPLLLFTYLLFLFLFFLFSLSKLEQFTMENTKIACDYHFI